MGSSLVLCYDPEIHRRALGDRVSAQGFLAEYDKARQNLRANIAAGLGNTFAYTGAPGTAPLPIFQAYFAGTPLSSAANQNPSNYTSANYSASAW